MFFRYKYEYYESINNLLGSVPSTLNPLYKLKYGKPGVRELATKKNKEHPSNRSFEPQLEITAKELYGPDYSCSGSFIHLVCQTTPLHVSGSWWVSGQSANMVSREITLTKCPLHLRLVRPASQNTTVFHRVRPRKTRLRLRVFLMFLMMSLPRLWWSTSGIHLTDLIPVPSSKHATYRNMEHGLFG